MKCGFAVASRLSYGFTLVELVIVIILLGILSAYALLDTGATPAEMTLPSQARRLAGDIRYAQTLAFTSGSTMRFTATPGTNGSYSVTCISTGCNHDNDFTHLLEKGAVLGVPLGSTAQLDFNTLGEPAQSASYTLSADGSTSTVSVAALTGFVTVTP